MSISVGDSLPNVSFPFFKGDALQQVRLSDLTSSKKTLIIGMPGAFTKTCSNDHLPSIIKNSKNFFSRGVEEILCVVVNDVYVTSVWAENLGATRAGIKVLADVEANFAKAIGMEFTAPAIGFFNRIQRVAILSENNIVTNLIREESRGTCERTSGEALLLMV